MSAKDDTKITWITCPDCGSKIGIVVSVGKAKPPIMPGEPAVEPTSVEEKLAAAGVDLELINVEDGEEVVIVSPKRFLGDLWGPVNDAVKILGGTWIREGRDSRWELRKEDLQ